MSEMTGAPAAGDASRGPLARRLVVLCIGTILLFAAAMLLLVRPGQEQVAAMFGMAAMFVLGAPVVWDAITSIRVHGFEATRFYMDQFIALALAACFAAGQYFTGSIVALVLIIGELLEERSMLGVQQAVRDLVGLMRVFARRLGEDGEQRVDAADLQTGDIVRVLPGDVIPADGTVVRGSSAVNQASVTGESLPVDVEETTDVYAGTTNLTGSIDVEVRRAGEGTLIGRVAQIVLEAQQSRAPIIRVTEKYARYYTPLVLMLAGTVLFFTGEIERAISVIIVSIPCAFVLAGPATMIAALATASRLGILVKSVRFFETASHIDTVVFDKTGTLTEGEPGLSELHTVNGFAEDDALSFAAAVEAHSNHPLARALVAEATGRDLEIPGVTELHEHAGHGISGRVDGTLVRVGRPNWLADQGVGVDDDRLHDGSTLGIALDDRLAATVFFRDNLRDEARTIGQRLSDLGVKRFLMVTGDRRAIAEPIAREIGFNEVMADCLPEDKLRIVQQLKAEGNKVAVVGDGINDAPALAAGDLSIAMGAIGSDLAIETADVALMNNDLHRLPSLVLISRRAIKLINQNLLCGLVFITAAIVLASFGWISPIAAAFLHEISAFLVIFNGARLLRFED